LDQPTIGTPDDRTVLKALKNALKKAGGKIAGRVGHEAAPILVERLTTTELPMRKIGTLSAELLVRKLRQEPTDDVTAVPARLVDGTTL